MIKHISLLLICFFSMISLRADITCPGGDLLPSLQHSIAATKNTNGPVPANRLIIPGKQIGLSIINTASASLYKSLGKPGAVDATMGGKSLASWFSKPVVHGNDTIINETNIYFTTPNFGMPKAKDGAAIIRITSPAFMTNDRIRVGSTLAQVQHYFSRAARTASYISEKTKQQVLVYDDAAAGIIFEIDGQQTCIGIVVYKPGESFMVIYSGLFEEVKDESSAIPPAAIMMLPDSGKTFRFFAGDKFNVTLTECVGCGVIWEIATMDKTKISFLEKTSSNRSCTDCVGGEVDKTFHFKVTGKGRSSLVLKYAKKKMAVMIDVK